MREVSGSTWTFQIIIFFILIFACFLSLVLSYSKAYTIKNRMLSIIEKYEGITDTSAEIINDFIYQNSYSTTGGCESGWYGATDLDGNYEVSDSSTKYYYCFKEYNNSDGTIYYEVQVFYRFYLPILGDIALYRIEGTTYNFVGADNRV